VEPCCGSPLQHGALITYFIHVVTVSNAGLRKADGLPKIAKINQVTSDSDIVYSPESGREIPKTASNIGYSRA